MAPVPNAAMEPAMQGRLAELLAHVGLPDAAPVRFETDGAAPGCRPAVGEAAAVAVAACAAAADTLRRRARGEAQEISVSTLHAAASLRSFMLLTLDGTSQGGAPSDDTPLARFHRTRDGRDFFIHGVLPHLAEGTLKVLGLDHASHEGIAAAVAARDAAELEDALADAGMCGCYARTRAEWEAHPQGRRNAAAGPVEIFRIGDAPPEPLPPGTRPLDGVRMLDLTRILAGPTCGRTMAEHGADVLLISSPTLPSVPSFVLDTGHGKRSAWLDLERAGDVAALTALAAGADVFSQGYRTGSLARRGLSPEDLARIRPGIVYVSINCYGHDGPWSGRPGWDQLGVAATGLAHAQGGEGPPALMPAAACDYVTGYLGALGAMAALARRATQGGSWHVRVSLAQTGAWLRDFAPPRDLEASPDASVPAAFMQESLTSLGLLRHLAPVARMSATPPRWARPAAPLGADAAAWAPAPA